MKCFALLLILLFLLISMTGCTQQLTVQWSKSFAGGYAYSVGQTADGGYILCANAAGSEDIWLIKTDQNGNKIWNNYFEVGLGSYWNPLLVQQTRDGGYIVCGTTYDEGTESEDITLLRIDHYGSMIWDKSFGGDDDDKGFSVQQTADDGYIVCGQTQSYAVGGCAIWLVKIDMDGDKIWDKVFGSDAWDEWDSGQWVQQTIDGGYIVCGYTESYGAGLKDIWLIKTDAEGNRLWDKTFGGEKDDIGNFVQQTKDRGYIICGSTNSFSDNDRAWLIKTDGEGNKLWSTTFGGMRYCYGYEAKENMDGSYLLYGCIKPFRYSIASYMSNIIRGYRYGLPLYIDDAYIWLLKTDNKGNKLEDKTFPKLGFVNTPSVQQTVDGGYVLFGTIEGLDKINYVLPYMQLLKIAPGR